MGRKLLVALFAAATMALAAGRLRMQQTSRSRCSPAEPNQVSGGDALISVTSKDGPLLNRCVCGATGPT